MFGKSLLFKPVNRFFKPTLESDASHKGKGAGAARDLSRVPFIMGGGGYNQVGKQVIQNQVGLRRNAGQAHRIRGQNAFMCRTLLEGVTIECGNFVVDLSTSDEEKTGCSHSQSTKN